MRIKSKLIIPLLVILGLQISGQSNNVKEVSNNRNSIKLSSASNRFEPKIINNAGPKYEAQAQKMQSIITSYNQFVYEKKFKEATWVTEHYFPKSEIEYFAKQGHSIISEYHVNAEEQSVKKEPEIVQKKVSRVFENETDELYILTYENNAKIETTWSHPFFIINRGWTEVKDIKVGDYSQTVNGKLKITKIDIRKLDKPVKVYNFEVEGNHNYFVSNDGVLVHNQNKGEYGKPIKTEYLTGGGGSFAVGKRDSETVGGKSISARASSTNWGNQNSLNSHFTRHGADFNARTPTEYAQKASSFLRDSQANRLPTKIDSAGTIRVYDLNSNTFGVYNPNGSTKSFYKPDPKIHKYNSNLDYWKAQPGN